MRSNYPEICSLLIENGAKICEGGNLVPLSESALNGIVAMRPVAGAEFGIEAEWEIHAGDLEIINKLGEGEFGEVFKVPPFIPLPRSPLQTTFLPSSAAAAAACTPAMKLQTQYSGNPASQRDPDQP